MSRGRGATLAGGGDRATSLATASFWLAEGQAAMALAAAQKAVAEQPRVPGAHHVLGLCQQAMGDTALAETSFRSGRRFDPGHEGLAIALANLLAGAARGQEAEAVLRGALGGNRRSVPLCVRLAALLTADARPTEALAVLARAAAGAMPDHAVLAGQAEAYEALGQSKQIRTVRARAVSLYPGSAVAHHNLAALDGDAGQFAAAARSVERALARGGDAPQTWLVYARALMGLRRLDEAERAFGEAIARQPVYLEAHRERAQLVWMRTGDRHAATALLDADIDRHSGDPDLSALRANVIHHAGDTAGAYAVLAGAIGLHPAHGGLHLAASHLASRLPGRAEQSVLHAERAAALLAGSDEAETALAAACLAVGDATRACEIAERLVDRRPADQRALAYRATAWRMLGDARYAALYDYAAFVQAWRMDVPDGWSDLDSYLADLGQALDEVHAFRTHPLDQSVRHGSQAPNLLTSENPVIRAFFQAVNGPIQRHLAMLGKGSDSLRRRNTGGYRFHGAWSVRLRADGFHTDHIHPQGWLSSACYIALPPAGEIARARKEAWIKFGQPGLPTSPALEAEHFVEPAPGMLVLFPSYMWHGTVPFASDSFRLSIAFDLLPG